MKFVYGGAFVSESELNKFGKELKVEVAKMNKVSKLDYFDDRASVNLSIDKELIDKVKKVILEKNKLNPEYIIVTGIGGSNLGTIAIQEAVLGKLYDHHSKPKILYADTVDSDSMYDILSILEPLLKAKKEVIVNVVSKSGKTSETMANFEILVALLKEHKKEISKNIVVTSDFGSDLWNFAEKQGFSTLEIPHKVGGRYSVFSPVGLFPLGMLGIDLDELLEGARKARKNSLENNVVKNLATLSALIQYIYYKKGQNISDLFLFSNDLESVGKWYRQLMGESLGKEKDNTGKNVLSGITPIVSVGSTDLHSMAQLYLGGPRDKLTTFVSVENNRAVIDSPKLKEYEKIIPAIAGKRLDEVMDAILLGVKKAFKKDKRPYIEIFLKDKSEESIGEFLQFKMMEIMYLGFLMNVNPFDQPAVEKYKIETRKILERK